MVRSLFVFALIFSSLQVQASATVTGQTITCQNKKQGLTIRAKLTNLSFELSEANVDVAVKMKRESGFQGVLRNEKIESATSNGNLVIKGEAEAKNLALELVLPENKLKRGFKNVTLSAFLDNPISDAGFYPNRVSVQCSSTLVN
jgi:hypothetical protein